MAEIQQKFYLEIQKKTGKPETCALKYIKYVKVQFILNIIQILNILH